MKYFIIILISFIGFSSAFAQGGIITIDLSYKVVLNPANGSRPPGVNNADIDNAIDQMNTLLETYWRGYRFRRVGTIQNVGGLNQFTTGPSRYYNTDFFASNGGALKDQMEAAAIANPAQYGWRNNAINIYIVNGICGGKCSFPSEDNIVLIGACSDGDGPLQLHEFGHYFNLCHTQGCPCGSCDNTKTGTCHTTPGNDGVDDTIGDLQCWGRNNIAQNAYGTTYNNLNNFGKNQVDNVFLNIMSYHGNTDRMTEGQMDRWTDAAKLFRLGVLDRNVHMVRKVNFALLQLGTSAFPYISVANGVNAAKAGDVLVVKPGTYPENLTINKRLSIRATRAGVVNIGAGSARQSLDTVLLAETEEQVIIAPDSAEQAKIDQVLAEVRKMPSNFGFNGEQSLQVDPLAAKTSQASSVNIHPNPFKEELHIHYQAPAGQLVVVGIYDRQGNKIAEIEQMANGGEEEEISFDAQGLKPGLYVYIIHIGDETHQGRLLKNE